MPIGGSNIAWDNTSPADTESAGLGDDRIRSMKTSVQEGLDNEHNWPASGGANTGYHRLGSARAYVGTQSAVSSSGTDGRIMVTSDSSRIFHVGSGGTMLLGSATVISHGSFPAESLPQRYYWAEESGHQAVAAGNATITYGHSGYSGIPFVFVSAESDSISATVAVFAAVRNVGKTTFVARMWALSDTITTPEASAGTIHWRSLGTRVL